MKQLFVANKNFTIGAGFGKNKSFQVGQTVTQTFYTRLASSLQRNFDVIEQQSKGRTLYTEDEKLLAIGIYLENVKGDGLIDQDALFALFHPYFPERSYNSFIKLLYAIRARDSHAPQQGLTSVAQDVADALNAYDSERFPLTVTNGTKLERAADKLLEEIWNS